MKPSSDSSYSRRSVSCTSTGSLVCRSRCEGERRRTPQVVLVLVDDVLGEVELLDRLVVRVVRHAQHEPRHAEPDVTRVLAVAECTPTGVLRRLEQRPQIAEAGQA